MPADRMPAEIDDLRQPPALWKDHWAHWSLAAIALGRALCFAVLSRTATGGADPASSMILAHMVFIHLRIAVRAGRSRMSLNKR